jgi:DNA-binding PadR family transcriptional regulator
MVSATASSCLVRLGLSMTWGRGPVRALRIGVLSGTVYPLLRRLEDKGWLSSRWEDVDPAAAGRPRRRLYRLTGEGEAAARAELLRVQASLASGTPLAGLA